MPETEAVEAETSAIPVSLVDGEPQPGDTITLQVVSVDAETGNITVTKAAVEEEAAPEGGGTESLAAEFQSPTQT